MSNIIKIPIIGVVEDGMRMMGFDPVANNEKDFWIEMACKAEEKIIDITCFDPIEMEIVVNDRDYELPHGLVMLTSVFVNNQEAGYSGQEFWRLRRTVQPSKYKYDIQGRRLKLNSLCPEKCTVAIKGDGFLLDDTGLPYVVSTHQDAIIAYMMYQNSRRKLARSSRGINEKREFERDWERLRDECIVDDNTRNPDVMEHIADIWGSIIPVNTKTIHQQGFEFSK